MDMKFQTNPARVTHREECKALIRDLILSFDRSTLLEELSDNAVPAGGVNDMSDVFLQPQAERLVVRDESGMAMGVRQVAFEGLSEIGSSSTLDALLPPPEYGEHTREVLSSYVSEKELNNLIETGVVMQR